MLEKHTLSKSTFMYGCQCPKRLHMHKYRPELKNPVNERIEYVKASGTSIGVLAQQLFPGGVDASPADAFGYQEAVIKTQELIAADKTVIYEAAFQYQGLLCVVDILVKNQDSWSVYEVKGTAGVKQQHIEDAAFQYYVITLTGLWVDDISIVHLNTGYVRRGALNIQKLFTKQSVLREVADLQSNLRQQSESLKQMLLQPEPVIDIGAQCSTPYECDFTNHCWSHIPKVDSIFDLVRGPAWELYEKGYRHLSDIPPDYNFSKPVAQQLAHYHSGEPLIDTEKIRYFVSSIQYPLYYLDFETVWPGVPEFDETSPFQQIPFQFSLHIQRSMNSDIEHYEFLGDGKTDPREAFGVSILDRCGSTGSIICYNTSFEKQRLEQLARLLPHHASALLELTQRMIDLMTPFQKRWYYHPEFKGKFSIKNVLPILCPNLSYDTLKVREGNMASIVYQQLRYQDEDTFQLHQEHLLAYCKMDTLAMVKILEVLMKL